MARKNVGTGAQPVSMTDLQRALAAQAGADSEEEDLEDELGEETRSDLLSALGELADPGGIKCQVIRVLPKDTAGVCGTYSASELSIDRVREDWGAGTYTVIFRNNQGRIEAKRKISIVAKLEPKAPALPDITGLMRELKLESEKNTQTMLLGFMQAQMQSQAELMKAIAARPQGSEFNAQSMLAMMVSVKELFKSDNTGASQIDTLVKGIELASKFGGGGDGEPSTLTAILKGLELAGPLIKGMGNGHANTPVPVQVATTRALPNKGGVQPIPQSSNLTPDESAGGNGPHNVGQSEIQTGGTSPGDGAENEGESMLDLLIWLREQLAFLVDKAKAGKDPGLYADYVLDNLPPRVTGDVVEAALQREDWFAQIARLNSGVTHYPEWFSDFRAAALEIIQEARSTQEDDSLREGAGEPADIDDTSPVSQLADQG